jgi:hypothetical protein
MSLLSLLFGRKRNPQKGEPYPEIPHFPAWSNPVFQVKKVIFPQGLLPYTFTIAPDKQHLYVLTCNLEDPVASMVYTMVCLDPNGKIMRQVDLPKRSAASPPGFVWESDSLLTLILSDEFISFDPITLNIEKKLKFFTTIIFSKEKN